MSDYYVYQLRRTDSRLPFYIGKGKGDRYKKHLAPASLNKSNFKNNCIKQAMSEGVEISSEILVDGLTEDLAFELEKLVILMLVGDSMGQGYCLIYLKAGKALTGHLKGGNRRLSI